MSWMNTILLLVFGVLLISPSPAHCSAYVWEHRIDMAIGITCTVLGMILIIFICKCCARKKNSASTSRVIIIPAQEDSNLQPQYTTGVHPQQLYIISQNSYYPPQAPPGYMNDPPPSYSEVVPKQDQRYTTSTGTADILQRNASR